MIEADILLYWINCVDMFWRGYAKQETRQSSVNALSSAVDSSEKQDWLKII